jgi:uncharacterized membrane protein
LNNIQGKPEVQNEVDARHRLLRRVLLIFIPVIVALGFILVLYLTLEIGVFNIIMAVMVGYTVSPFGPEIVIPAGILALEAEGLYSLTYVVIVAVVFVDFILGFFVFLNFEIIEAIPWIGKWVKKSKEVFSKKLKKGKETVALSALALYVALPFQGSGGFVGSIMGRVVGLNRHKVLLAVLLGSVLGAVPIGIAAHYGLAAFLTVVESGEFFYQVIGILIIIIFIIVVVYFIRRERNSRNESLKREEENDVKAQDE